MKNFWRDAFALVGMIAGIGGTAILSLGGSLDILHPGLGKTVVAVVSVAVFGAGLITRTITSNTQAAIAATTTSGLPHA